MWHAFGLGEVINIVFAQGLANFVSTGLAILPLLLRSERLP